MKLFTGIALPTPGTTRLKTGFSWTPRLIGTTYIWLEKYDVLEAYIPFTYLVVIDEKEVQITEMKWKVISKRLRNPRKS